LKPFLNFKDNSILITVHPATILLSYLYEAWHRYAHLWNLAQSRVNYFNDALSRGLEAARNLIVCSCTWAAKLQAYTATVRSHVSRIVFKHSNWSELAVGTVIARIC
jgi:hypothetical protein